MCDCLRCGRGRVRIGSEDRGLGVDIVLIVVGPFWFLYKWGEVGYVGR